MGYGSGEYQDRGIAGTLSNGEIICKPPLLHLGENNGEKKILPANNEECPIKGGGQYKKKTSGGWENRDQSNNAQSPGENIGISFEKLVRNSGGSNDVASSVPNVGMDTNALYDRSQEISESGQRIGERKYGNMVNNADISGISNIEESQGNGIGDSIRPDGQYETKNLPDYERGNDLGNGSDGVPDIQSELHAGEGRGTNGGNEKRGQFTPKERARQGLKYALSSHLFL